MNNLKTTNSIRFNGPQYNVKRCTNNTLKDMVNALNKKSELINIKTINQLKSLIINFFNY